MKCIQMQTYNKHTTEEREDEETFSNIKTRKSDF